MEFVPERCRNCARFLLAERIGGYCKETHYPLDVNYRITMKSAELCNGPYPAQEEVSLSPESNLIPCSL